jgi:hypothetical protein
MVLRVVGVLVVFLNGVITFIPVLRGSCLACSHFTANVGSTLGPTAVEYIPPILGFGSMVVALILLFSVATPRN